MDGSGTYSATNIPAVPTNVMANYIANLTISGAGLTSAPNISMEYQNSDFYGGAPNLNNALSTYLNIWYYNKKSIIY